MQVQSVGGCLHTLLTTVAFGRPTSCDTAAPQPYFRIALYRQRVIAIPARIMPGRGGRGRGRGRGRGGRSRGRGDSHIPQQDGQKPASMELRLLANDKFFEKTNAAGASMSCAGTCALPAVMYLHLRMVECPARMMFTLYVACATCSCCDMPVTLHAVRKVQMQC